MLPKPSSELHAALQLIRAGRFAQAVTILQQRPSPRSSSKANSIELSVLADALQRIGNNDQAEEIATRTLNAEASALANARCHFTLGNVYRDRGETERAIEHLQIAARLSNTANDLELSSWAQLRLMVVLAELSGAQTAMVRLDEVKRVLTRFGDARPFAGLHLWLVEVESMRGNLESARKHLETADSLLSAVEDVWLRGYFAINKSAVHYYSAEIPEAKRWAEIATECAQQSGHRATQRAAHANLGNIEFALGDHVRAEACFDVALSCCEPGSVHQIAILDNIAQIWLHAGDLDRCRELISTLDALIERNRYAKRRHYNAYALQTKIRLLLREGKNCEALAVSDLVSQILSGLPQGRVGAETHLLNAEALLANGQCTAAVNVLSNVFGVANPLSADLLAKFEHISGRTLASAGGSDLARVHLERAVRVFRTIEHFTGEDRSLQALSNMPVVPTECCDLYPAGCQGSLDRIRALLDLRTRPELFGQEAISLLKELSCTSSIDLIVNDGTQERLIHHSENNSAATIVAKPMSIAFNAGSQRTVTLSYTPLQDVRAQYAALSFQRVIKQILDLWRNEAAPFADQEIVWTASEGTASGQTVFFGTKAMVAILRTVKQIATIDVSILVTGETGTGKEVIARAIHEHSKRSGMPFLALNCAAVPKDLIESQLFGHRKGAFSGATDSHQGIVRAANGGTLFLDEIGEMPMDMQAKLLRFLEMSEVHPVGESHPVKVDVRLIFATNGDLEEAVSQNRFRQDLFYRLNVIPIKVPPLRERREEIPVLTNLFAQRFATEFAKEPIRFSSAAMELLILYSWPGNVRQLSNEVRRLTALAESATCVTPDHLSPQLQAQRDRPKAATEGTPQMQVRIDQSLEKATAYLEAEMIKHALRQAGGRVSTAASTLGISRKGLYLKRLRLGLTDFNERAH